MKKPKTNIVGDKRKAKGLDQLTSTKISSRISIDKSTIQKDSGSKSNKRSSKHDTKEMLKGLGIESKISTLNSIERF